MSNIGSLNGSPDGGYRFYQKSIDELENELTTQTEKLKKKNEERIADKEEAFQAELNDQKDEYIKTIESVKEAANKTIETERQNAKAQVDRMKNETYDKFGRFNGLEAKTVQDQFETSQKSWDQEKTKLEQTNNEQEEAFRSRIDQLNKEHRESQYNGARSARDSASEAYTKIFKDQRGSYDEFKKQAEEKYNRLNQNRVDELNFQRRMAERNNLELRQDYQNRYDNTQNSNSLQLSKQKEAFQNEINQQTLALNAGHDRTNSELRSQLQDMVTQQDSYYRDKGQGTRDAIREFEADWRGRENATVKAYDEQIQKMKQEESASVENIREKNRENLLQKDKYLGEALKDQVEKNYRREKDISSEFEREKAQTQLRMSANERKADDRLSNRLDQANEDRNKALVMQANAYKETIATKDKQAKDTLKTMEQTGSRKIASDPMANVSPLVEAIVRKNIEKEYATKFETEQNRSKEAINSIQENFAARVTDAEDQAQTRETLISQQHANERTRDRTSMLEYVQDVQFDKETKLKEVEGAHRRDSERIQKSLGGNLEKQRRQFEEMMSAQKLENEAKVSTVRAEAEMNAKAMQRAFVQKQNDLIRTYEKKFADAREDQQNLLTATKEEAQKMLREQERQHRLDMQQQQRSYETRIAQAEIQFKEREKTLAQAQEDQLEKIKKSYAEISKKKS